MYVSRAVLIILMVHHFLCTRPYKMSVFERSVTCVHNIETGGHFLIKVMGGGGSDTKVLPRAEQQLNMLPRADTKSHFLHPKADTTPHFESARVDK